MGAIKSLPCQPKVRVTPASGLALTFDSQVWCQFISAYVIDARLRVPMGTLSFFCTH